MGVDLCLCLDWFQATLLQELICFRLQTSNSPHANLPPVHLVSLSWYSRKGLFKRQTHTFAGSEKWHKSCGCFSHFHRHLPIVEFYYNYYYYFCFLIDEKGTLSRVSLDSPNQAQARCREPDSFDDVIRRWEYLSCSIDVSKWTTVPL